jgi:uncharacterized protein YjbI with pentapeptide repeats
VDHEEQKPSQKPAGWERSLGDRLLRTLRMNPDKWTIGDRRLAILAVAIGLGIVVITIFGYVFEWKWTGLAKQTFWDWLSLLIVPVVLALGGYFFTRSENRRTREDADRQRSLDRELADDRRQDEMLQAYLDGVSQLLTDKERPLHRAEVGDYLSTVARARTLTVLARLDGERKGSVLQFLYESGLIRKDRQVLALRGADLSGARLPGADLRGANLHGADLSGAILYAANLSGTDLSRADLKEADLLGADLSGADLSEAVLLGTELYGVNLIKANLNRTNLIEANLTGADLRYAEGWTEEQLARAKYIEPATLPNGQKYQDRPGKNVQIYENWIETPEGKLWLKALREQGENSGPP